MKKILKSKDKEVAKTLYKCYKCGVITDEKTVYCPNCLEDGFKIRTIEYK